MEIRPLGFGLAEAAMPMSMSMEHPEPSVWVPPLVSERVVLRFCAAVQQVAAATGAESDVAVALRALRLRLDNLRGLAVLCQLALLGHPHSLNRVRDEFECLSVDFPDALEEDLVEDSDEEWPDERVALAAAVNMFAAASFANKDRPNRRDRFIAALVQAIEAAIAFPLAFSREAAGLIDTKDQRLLPAYSRASMSIALQRLLDGDIKCIPRAPRGVRTHLRLLAKQWMRANPVDAFLAAVSGPRVCRIVHWEDPARKDPDAARIGDQVTLLLERAVHGSRTSECTTMCDRFDDAVVMFSPYAPTNVVRVVDEGLEVLVPERARTGPIVVLNKHPDLSDTSRLLDEYAACFASEWSASLFGAIRIDTWAFPMAFGPPSLEIMPTSGTETLPPPPPPVAPNPGTPPRPTPIMPGMRTTPIAPGRTPR